MQARSCCSKAAHPWAVWPCDAQHPVPPRLAKVLRLSFFLRFFGVRTQYCAHDAYTWVLVGAVGSADSEFGDGREFGGGSGFCELLGVVLAGHHLG